MNVRESLLSLRREILDRLRQLDAPAVSELERIERALAAIDPQEVKPGDFSKLTIIDAVRIYLSRVEKPVSEAALTRALIAGGAGSAKGSRAPEWKIAQSISHHANKGNLTVSEGMVGLPEWKKSHP